MSQHFAKLLGILRSRRGDVLVDSMIGAVVVGLIISAMVATLLVMGQASINTSHNTARTVLLASTASQQSPVMKVRAVSGTPAKTSPVTITKKVMERDVKVTLWRELDPIVDGVPSATSTVYARTSAYNGDTPNNCTALVKENTGGCLTTSIRLDESVGGVGVTKHPLVLTTPSAAAGNYKLAETITDVAQRNIDAVMTLPELRYVFKIESPSPTRSTVTFTDDHGQSFAVDIPAGRTGYHYGSLDLGDANGTGVTISYSHSGTPAVFDQTAFLLYEAPQS